MIPQTRSDLPVVPEMSRWCDPIGRQAAMELMVIEPVCHAGTCSVRMS
jgi:hypothetical protein